MTTIPLFILFAIFSIFFSVASAEEKCGITDYPGHHAGERIINGTKVPQGKYPWLASVLKKLWDGSSWAHCTATIVSKKWILTAAHCIEGEMKIVVGSVDNRSGKKIKVKRHIMHEGYSEGKSLNDIALIELAEELTYSKDIRRICLTAKRQEADPSTNVVIAGWGDLSRQAVSPSVLHEGTGRVVADSICESIYEVGYDSERLVCVASHNDTMPYYGDSGGPGLVNSEGRWIEIGVADYVYLLGEQPPLKKPSGYARVSYFCDWIAEKTDNEVLCDK